MTDFKKLLTTLDNLADPADVQKHAVLTEASPIERAMKPITDKQKMFGKTNNNGTIGSGEDNSRERVIEDFEKNLSKLVKRYSDKAQDIGGSFRSPGIIKEMRDTAKRILSNDELWKGLSEHTKYDRMVDELAEQFNKMDERELSSTDNEVVYHGSRSKFDVAEIRQAHDVGGVEGSNANAIYATVDKKMAMFMGMTKPDADIATFPPNPRNIVFGDPKDSIRFGEKFYLYTFLKKDFEPGGADNEVKSKPGLTELKPVNREEFNVDDYKKYFVKPTPEEQQKHDKYMKAAGLNETGRIKEGK